MPHNNTQDAMSFKDKTIIVTGGGRGIGRGISGSFAAQGANIIICGRRQPESLPPNSHFISLDIREADAAKTLVAFALEKTGRLDCLINNAGGGPPVASKDASPNLTQKVIALNLLAPINLAQAAYEPLKTSGGSIVNISSVSATRSSPGSVAYGAAKAGLSGFMRTLCLEGAKYDIRVNVLSPTARSRMTENLMPEEILEKLTVESVSAGLVYLVCDDAPNRMIMCAGAGGYSETKVFETQGINLSEGAQTAENVAKFIDKIRDTDGQEEYTNGGQQGAKFLTRIQGGDFIA